MAEYKANSHKSKTETKTEERKVTPVVTGKASTKPNEIRKLTGLFVSDDAQNVKSYVLMDVLVPAVKKAISDIVTNGIDMILYGESGGKRKTSSRNYVPYRSYSERGDSRDRERPRVVNRFDYDDIVFDTRGDAELVRKEMLDTIADYGMVTVADMYEMAGLTVSHTAVNYGWFNIRTSEVVRVRDGYILKLPKAMPID